jgi:repressor LexA
MVSSALANAGIRAQDVETSDELHSDKGVVLTPPQERLFQFIREFIERKTCPPTVREIQRGLAMSSTSLVAFHLRNLEKKGAIVRRPRAARGLTIVS